MAPSRKQIESVVTRIQDDFLKHPALTLTPRDASRRFHLSETLCEAVLAVLAEANVLAVSAQGVYARFVPDRLTHVRTAASWTDQPHAA